MKFLLFITHVQTGINQTDKRALAIMEAVKNFHHYLAGSKFNIMDHKLLLVPKKLVPDGFSMHSLIAFNVIWL